MLTCPVKEYSGFDCPGCGFQRSLEQLLQGHIWESVLLFPALIPFFVTLVLLLLHLRFRFKNGAKWLVTMYVITAVILVANYTFKLLNGSI